ncbi:MAG: GNAT family N-acetyltransferase [Pseudomonadota bacterium]
MSEVRRAAPSDAEGCAQILNDWIDSTAWMTRIHTAQDVVRHYKETVFPEREVWVVEDPPRAFMALDPAHFVTALYSAVPGAGLGHRLLDHAKCLRAELRLWTFVANTRAQSFYLREGFSEVARTEGDNEEGLPDIRYEWRRP